MARNSGRSAGTADAGDKRDGIFCYGFAWGVNRGLLNRGKYGLVIARAWAGLTGAISPAGNVFWGQQVDGQPNRVREDSTHEYVTGTFLLAGSER